LPPWKFVAGFGWILTLSWLWWYYSLAQSLFSWQCSCSYIFGLYYGDTFDKPMDPNANIKKI